MRKAFVIAIANCLLYSLCFAQASSPNAVSQAAPCKHLGGKAEKGMFLQGLVKSVSVADTAKKTKSEIVIADASGMNESFLVKATTTVYDKASGSASFDSIKSGDKVKLKYVTTSEGLKEAVSITRLN